MNPCRIPRPVRSRLPGGITAAVVALVFAVLLTPASASARTPTQIAAADVAGVVGITSTFEVATPCGGSMETGDSGSGCLGAT